MKNKQVNGMAVENRFLNTRRYKACLSRAGEAIAIISRLDAAECG